MRTLPIVLAIGGVALGLLLARAVSDNAQTQPTMENDATEKPENLALATFGGGCFWCTEAVFERLEGVNDVISGYAGGDVENPTYKEVTSGRTGHAEVVQISYDPETISYEELLKWHFRSHNPTTLNRQGADVGTQYRSIILYHDDAQKQVAEKVMQAAQEAYDGKVVTELVPLQKFYAAEDYHQDYYRNNPSAGYCQFVIAPKLDKLDL